MDFKGKVAIVTGGATGIGEAVSKKLASLGASVVIVGLTDDPVNEVVQEIEEEYGTGVLGLTRNVGKKQEAEEVVKQSLEKFEKIDILIANAGVMPEIQPVADFSDERFEGIIEANIKGIFYITRACIPALRESEGCIVASGSVAGLKGLPKSASYSGSKGWIHSFMKSLALEEGPNGIRVNVVAPGPIHTEMTDADAGAISEEMETMMKNTTLFGRRGTTEEAANLYAFLASNEASFITGGIYVVDGGNLLVSGPEGEKAKSHLKQPPKSNLNLKHQVVTERTYK